ncbi:unnamed protein product [Prorocentrum cordatum]|uniref:B30.2/SPRY domain-containing protein n=1 Tax=Prorocentrum cordatum TaxID=2364126 RepID=A0ABN9UT66_9DINO|nr:unnamed protein product [Polarella glacialis]
MGHQLHDCEGVLDYPRFSVGFVVGTTRYLVLSGTLCSRRLEWDQSFECSGPDEIQDLLGNMWADFFARIGADSHAHADVYRDAQKTHLADIKRDFDFMSRFAQVATLVAPQPFGLRVCGLVAAGSFIPPGRVTWADGPLGAVEFLVPDTTVNVMTSTVGDILMSLQDNGFQCLLAGARANVGVRSGRYMFEIKIVESPSSKHIKSYMKIGFSIAGSSLLLDSDTSVSFDSTGLFSGSATRAKVSERLFAGDVVACLINLEKGSPNCNTISLFKNGVRVAQPQALPESLQGKPMFPTVAFKCMTLHTNFGPEPICSLPFKCHMVGSALKTDAEVTTYEATDEGEVLFPVSLPDQGSFDWLDMYLEKNPGYTEISDRAIRDWAEKSWGPHPPSDRPARTSNDRPEMGFGVWAIDDGTVKGALRSLCALQKRKYVVMEVKGNLFKEDRAEALKPFKASNFKTSAAVLVGTPTPEFKKRSQMLFLKQKQDAANKEHQEKFEATKKKWLFDKRQKELEKARQKAAKDKEKAAKARAKAIEEAKKKAEAAKEGKEVVEEEKKEEEPEEEEPEEAEPEEPEPVEDDPPKMTLTAEEKQLSFKPAVIPDLTEYVMNTTFTKFSLPEKEEGFDEIRYEFLKDGAKCKKFVQDWISSRKLTTRVEEIKPSAWFHTNKKSWEKAVHEWQAALAKYSSNLAKKRSDKAAKEARKKQAAAKAAAAKAKAEEDKKNGEVKEDDKKQEVVEEIEEEEDDDDEPEPQVDFEGIDVFGVEDVTDIGGGMPLYKEFTQDDWTLMSFAFELHLMAHSFKKDCGDEDLPGLHVDHLDHYYQKYFKKGFSPQSFGKETSKDAVELVKDMVLVDSKGTLVSCLQEEMETYQAFVKITEEARRYRNLRIDLGEEDAVLKLAAQRGGNQQYGQKRKQSWGPPQGQPGAKGGWGQQGWGQQGWAPAGKKGKKGKGWGK